MTHSRNCSLSTRCLGWRSDVGHLGRVPAIAHSRVFATIPPEVKKWLAERPRYHEHFTPTSSSWLNQIERWFAEITRKRIRRGTFRSVRELIKAINDYVRIYNQNPRPFQWVASASRIIRKVNKYKDTSDTAD